jgi:hypothetical protein
MTVFVLSTRDHVLHVFADAASALSSDVVNAFDVDASGARDEALLFFSDDGSGLRREQGAGLDYLRPWASCSACSLPQVTHLVSGVKGAAPLDTLEAITKYLAASAKTDGNG